VQQQVMSNSYGGYTVETSSEQTLAMEKEIQDLQAQLEVGCLCRILHRYTCLYSCLSHLINVHILKIGEHSKNHC
jgi:hypothetical protein